MEHMHKIAAYSERREEHYVSEFADDFAFIRCLCYLTMDGKIVYGNPIEYDSMEQIPKDVMPKIQADLQKLSIPS